MGNADFTVELEIQNKKGLHARAAAAFVKTVEDMDVEIEVERIGQVANGKSIMGLMLLAAAKGTTIKVSACGTEAQKAVEKISELINNKFGEE